MHDPFALTEGGNSEDLDDPKLIAISQDYLRALESGARPDREIYLNRFPELREHAIECLDGIELAFSMGKHSPDSVRKRMVQNRPQTSEPMGLSEPLGDFRLVREIGRGGMGIVYEAFQLSLARNVALKVLPFAAALDERHRKRFLVEAQSAAQLHHPNIVPVYAVGCERGTHFYAMQFIDGRPISAALFDDLSNPENGFVGDMMGSTIGVHGERTSSGSTSKPHTHSRSRPRNRNRIIASLIAQAADALDYAHSCGIVHRDVKPGNLLLDASGKIWITDFGLAQISTNDHMTQTGDLLGTLRYMSPEQASGHPGVIDHRSDVYSLGATLYEMLTRKPVHEGIGRQSLLHQILNEEPRSLRKLDRTIPEELEIITLKALRQLPIDRYESARALGDDLRRFLSETPVLARRPTIIDNTRKWMRRHPSTVLSLLFALVAAVASLAVVTLTVTHQKSLTSASLEKAEKRLSVAQAAADEMIRMAENELSISPMEEVLRQRLLTSALKYYQSLLDETKDDLKTHASLQVTRDRAEAILSDLTLVQEDRQLKLLNDPSVQRELQLTPSQIESFGSTHSRLAEASASSPLEEAKQRKRLADELLSVEQHQRLTQIAIQLQGPPGLRDMVVVGKLRLTPDQIQAIQSDILSFLTQGQFPFPVVPESNSDVNEGAPLVMEFIAKSMEQSVRTPEDLISPQVKAAMMDLLLKRLTPDQLNKWHELTGARFEAK